LIKLYQDGVLDIQSMLPFSTPLRVNNSQLFIGLDIPGVSEYFSGKLDDIRIYNRGLDQSEITALYHEGTTLSVTTAPVSSITQSSALCGGNVTSYDDLPVSARGVCWNTSEHPVISNSHSTDGSGAGTFTSNLTGLLANTLYYVRAYAVNEEGTAYGNEINFTSSFMPELYMVGNGCSAGWNTTAALPMTGTAGIYSLTTTLSALKYIKFITTLGQWVPMYGTDAEGTSTGGNLVYRATAGDPDPLDIPTPENEGVYTVLVNTNTLTYAIIAK